MSLEETFGRMNFERMVLMYISSSGTFTSSSFDSEPRRERTIFKKKWDGGCWCDS
jgi:hypothetical protein